MKFSSEKYSQKIKVSSFGNYEKIKLRSGKRVGKVGVSYNGYTYFTSPHHPLESELPLEVESGFGINGGIGIEKFFEGKNIFITGATGLVGKALVEKLLRSTSVGKIYLLVKADNREAALDRLTKEIVNSELFKCIQEKHGNSYDEFVREKLIPVVGNICEPNLGMDTYSTHEIIKEVDVIIESAASTTLNDRYDDLLDTNVNAPQRLMRFAKTCKNLKLFVHISTAFVNGRKEGIIFEKPLVMGDDGRNEAMSSSITSLPRVDLADEIKLAMRTIMASKDSDATKDLKRLGLERAALYGWYNPYHMTKAMGEMALNEMRGGVPVLIIRPSVIESTFNEPLPGWIQGNRMYDPVIISYGKGLLPAYLADPDVHMDIVPVDMVANTTIAAIAKHGITDKPDLNVYHAATGYLNPLPFSDFFEYIYEHFSSSPLSPDLEGIKKMKLFSEFNDFSRYLRDGISELNSNAFGVNGNTTLQKHQKQYKARVAYAEQLCKMYEFVGFFKARFHTGNTQKLLEEMSKEEQVNFEIDARKIDWRKYFVEVHIPGLRKHVLNGARASSNTTY
ncbi:Acyl-CoA reductase [Handroanthus impetiginosus]|uniref:Fatty acyl-CoA reductase n=1 Tax=Handroanthus impetiginosus TaxID=429701 RepID=A0A2G9GIU2_9LAMI|nr:Acyl-CoA reductase [Handroanthus impetiginosus]